MVLHDKQADADTITSLEAQIEYCASQAKKYDLAMRGLLQTLAAFDPNNALLERFQHIGGEYASMRPWIAANHFLAERPGQKMKTEQLIDELVKRGCAAGRRQKGGPAAAVRSGLTRAVQSGYFKEEGAYIWRTDKAPEPGTEGERD